MDPERIGGRENLEAIEFLRNTNRILGEQVSGAVTMAEDLPISLRFSSAGYGRSGLLVQAEPRLDA